MCVWDCDMDHGQGVQHRTFGVNEIKGCNDYMSVRFHAIFVTLPRLPTLQARVGTRSPS